MPMATSAQVDHCVAAAKNGARAMAKLTGYERNQLLQKAADLLASRVEEFARTISLEEGKPLAEARGE